MRLCKSIYIVVVVTRIIYVWGHGGKLATGVGWHTAFISAVFGQIAAPLKHRLQ